ncbi:MAG: YkgJ family cysteine cluster protein [Candidatus Diapherotrites archaeon]|nr:YkgJ family cysteine cluster protein [Candidatus Diapherotrites archaeon]
MGSLQKLTKKQESEFCLSCGECCKRYWITLLPSEASKIARLLKTSKGTFLPNYCMLNVKLYPKTTPGVLTFPTTFFPQRLFDLIKKEVATPAESFFIVPQVVLSRKNKIIFKFDSKRTQKEQRFSCSFLKAENACEIYPVRPEPCKLFPFIAMPDLREQYPFCELFKSTQKNLSIESKIYYKRVQEYFKNVDEKSFLGVWQYPPKKGLLFLGEKQIGEISLDELVSMMPKSSKKKQIYK